MSESHTYSTGALETVPATPALSALDRAAITLLSMGEAGAAGVLRCLSRDELLDVTQSMARMQGVKVDQVQHTLTDFFDQFRSQSTVRGASRQFLQKSLDLALGEQLAGSVLNHIYGDAIESKFNRLHWAQPQWLSQQLSREHVRMQALFLSLLPPVQSSEVLRLMPRERADLVLLQIAALREIDHELLIDLETVVDSCLDRMSTQSTRVQGVQQAADIITDAFAALSGAFNPSNPFGSIDVLQYYAREAGAEYTMTDKSNCGADKFDCDAGTGKFTDFTKGFQAFAQLGASEVGVSYTSLSAVCQQVGVDCSGTDAANPDASKIKWDANAPENWNEDAELPDHLKDFESIELPDDNTPPTPPKTNPFPPTVQAWEYYLTDAKMTFVVTDAALCGTAAGQVECDDQADGSKTIKASVSNKDAYAFMKANEGKVNAVLDSSKANNTDFCGKAGVECTYDTSDSDATKHTITDVKWSATKPTGWDEDAAPPAWLPQPTSTFTATPRATISPIAAGGDELINNANAVIGIAEDALDAIGDLRSAIGAVQNRLEHTYNNLSNMVGNTTESSGRIMDVDYASESEHMSQQQILMQASTAMLKQASTMNQMVLSLVQG